MKIGIKNLLSFLTSLVKNIPNAFNIWRLEKPGRAIFLMKQRARLIKAKRKENKHPVSQRLTGLAVKLEEEKMACVESEKRIHYDANAIVQQ